MIKVNKLHKYYNRKKKNEIHVLNDISLDFPEKGLVVLFGASGSGKTTLLNVIGGLDKVQSGQIQIDKKELGKYSPRKWDNIRNTEVGYIFQNYNLLKDLSVYENLEFVLSMIGLNDKAEVEKRVNYILHAVGMYKFRKRKASELSGGQQQRVAIARALIKNPRIIIADEPTGNLDTKNTLEVMNIIKSISENKLVLLVTHEKNIADFYADRIIEFKDGMIVSDCDNSSAVNHDFNSDEAIYLKDMVNLYDNDNPNYNLKIYSDNATDLSKTNIKLIVKNNTIYIDMDSDLQKIKLVKDNPAIVIKDEHFKKKTKEEMIDTSFDMDILNNSHLTKNVKSTISFKKSIKLAISKIKGFGKRGKLLLFAFIISGLLFSIMVGFVANITKSNINETAVFSKTIVTVSDIDIDNNNTSYENFYSSIKAIDNNAVVITNNSSRQLALRPYIVGYSEKIPSIKASEGSYYNEFVMRNFVLGNISQLKNADLSFGRLPKNDLEIVVSKKLINDTLSTTAQSAGVWSKEALMELEYRFYLEDYVLNVINTNYNHSALSLKIVGIADIEGSTAYFTDTMLNVVSWKTDDDYTYINRRGIDGNYQRRYDALTYMYPYNLLKNNYQNRYTIEYGAEPQNGQYLYNIFNFKEIFNLADSEIDNDLFPFTYTYKIQNTDEEHTRIISGLYKSNEFEISSFTDIDTINSFYFNYKDNGYRKYIISTSYHNEMVGSLKDKGYDSAEWVYGNDIQQEIERKNKEVQAYLVIIISLLAITAVGFYFLIRSSLMGRIYEISVFRALGVKKKDIYKSFIIEIILVTIITGFVGYTIGSGFILYIINQLQFFTTLGLALPISISFVSYVVGLIGLIGINIIFGLIPVIMLLTKTPSQILSKYDI